MKIWLFVHHGHCGHSLSLRPVSVLWAECYQMQKGQNKRHRGLAIILPNLSLCTIYFSLPKPFLRYWLRDRTVDFSHYVPLALHLLRIIYSSAVGKYREYFFFFPPHHTFARSARLLRRCVHTMKASPLPTPVYHQIVVCFATLAPRAFRSFSHCSLKDRHALSGRRARSFACVAAKEPTNHA